MAGKEYVVNVGNRLDHGAPDGSLTKLREGDAAPSDLTDEQLLSLRQAMVLVPKDLFEAQKGAVEAQQKAAQAKAEADAEALRVQTGVDTDAVLAQREVAAEVASAQAESPPTTLPALGERSQADVDRENAAAADAEKRSAEQQKADAEQAKKQEELQKKEAEAAAKRAQANRK